MAPYQRSKSQASMTVTVRLVKERPQTRIPNVKERKQKRSPKLRLFSSPTKKKRSRKKRDYLYHVQPPHSLLALDSLISFAYVIFFYQNREKMVSIAIILHSFYLTCLYHFNFLAFFFFFFFFWGGVGFVWISEIGADSMFDFNFRILSVDKKLRLFFIFFLSFCG